LYFDFVLAIEFSNNAKNKTKKPKNKPMHLNYKMFNMEFMNSSTCDIAKVTTIEQSSVKSLKEGQNRAKTEPKPRV
jgi:hypothetical protein